MSITREKVNSSNIESVGYDYDKTQLIVAFHSGKEYKYADVPEKVYLEMINAKSVGSYFHANVKNKYEIV